MSVRSVMNKMFKIFQVGVLIINLLSCTMFSVSIKILRKNVIVKIASTSLSYYVKTPHYLNQSVEIPKMTISLEKSEIGITFKFEFFHKTSKLVSKGDQTLHYIVALSFKSSMGHAA